MDLIDNEELGVVESAVFGCEERHGWSLRLNVKKLYGGFFTFIALNRLDEVFNGTDRPEDIKFLAGRAVGVVEENGINHVRRFV